MYVYTYLHMHKSMDGCLYVRIYVYVCKYVYLPIFAGIYLCMYVTFYKASLRYFDKTIQRL